MSDLSVWAPDTEPDIPAFPTALLGYQRKAVDRYLKGLLEVRAGGSEVLELHPGPEPSSGQLDRYRDLGVEIADLLSAVQETAMLIRERAESDAAQWREQSTLEVQNRIAEAQSAAEDLREAAWEVSTQMVAQIQEMQLKAYRSIEKHSQEVIAEAENEAHRIREDARRRADSIRSNAHVESMELEEKTRGLCDQMIDSAEQQVAAIQERVLALERHRDQLLEEIGGIRSGVAPIGVKLVDQTGGLIYPNPPEEDGSVHVTPHHEMSGLVRLITPSGQSEDSSPQSTGDEAAEGAEVPTEAEGAAEDTAEEQERAPAPAFDHLFTSLRRTVAPPSGPVKARAEPDRPPGGAPRMDEERMIELREEMLLPISNQFLRLFKRLLTEEQNRVLDGLRTGQLNWGVEEVEGRLRSHLEMLMEQSWQAGHRAAERVSGRGIPAPDLAMGEEAGFTPQLVGEVREAMGPGDSSEPSQRSRLASRMFRVWRNEKLDQHLREVSERYYQRGLSESLKAIGAAV